MRWIHGGADRQPFVQLAGTDLWLLRVPVEDGGRFEYKLAVGPHGQEQLIVDPLNPARAGDPFGENSVARTRGYERPEWSLPRGAPAGRIETIARRERAPSARRATCGVYLPAGHDPDAALSARRRARRRRLRHLCRPAGRARQPDRRGRDPAGDRGAGADARPAGRIFRRPASIRRFLVGDLLPALAARWRISEAPAERVLLGASLGAVASLVTAFRHPGRLRRAGAEVGLLHPRRAQAQARGRIRSSTASRG